MIALSNIQLSATVVLPASLAVTATLAPPATRAEASQHVPRKWAVPTSSLGVVNAVADVLQKPPATIDSSYADECCWVAKLVGLPVSTTGSSSKSSFYLGDGRTNSRLGVNEPRVWDDSENDKHRASIAQASVISVAERSVQFAGIAESLGLSVPKNPFLEISALNSRRQAQFSWIDVPAPVADSLVAGIRAYVDMLELHNRGELDSTLEADRTSQLSHVEISFDGLGGTGNAAVDIQALLPSAEDRQKEASRRALEILDFSKRIPKLLFTADYVPEKGGASRGTIIGWKRIPDASGYVVKRRAVFSGKEQSYELSNSSALSMTKQLRGYARAIALSFFSDDEEANALLFLDSDVLVDDEYYVYRVAAYQNKLGPNSSIFSVSTLPVVINKSLAGELMSLAGERDAVSVRRNPWDALAAVTLGSEKYGWVLAASNVQASIARRDDVAVTRKYSYLTAEPMFLFEQAKSNLVVMPERVDDVMKQATDFMQEFGVTQTIRDILDEAYVTYYFDGRDPSDVNLPSLDSTRQSSSKFMTMLYSSIDPDTAMVNLSYLRTNITQLKSGSQQAKTSSGPQQVDVPDIDSYSGTRSPKEYADLMTFDGIGDLMRVVRESVDGQSAPAEQQGTAQSDSKRRMS